MLVILAALALFAILARGTIQGDPPSRPISPADLSVLIPTTEPPIVGNESGVEIELGTLIPTPEPALEPTSEPTPVQTPEPTPCFTNVEPYCPTPAPP